MEKDKKILLVIVGILMLVATSLGILAIWKSKDNPTLKSDAVKFKEEYEFLNGQVNEDVKMNYPLVSLSEDNPFIYKTDDEVVKILENGTGVIYFGFSSCPWCRSMVPSLLKAAESTNLSEIIYVDIKNIRDKLSLDDNNQIVVEDEGTNGYKEILKQMDEVLEPYILTNKDGKKVPTNEKRLYAPTVVTVKNGKIMDIHVDTVSSQKSGYNPLTEKEQEKLFQIYQKMILKLLDSSCDESC